MSHEMDNGKYFDNANFFVITLTHAHTPYNICINL